MEIYEDTKSVIKRNLAKKHQVEERFLEYLGLADEIQTVGKVFVYYNIMDKAHPKYKSTVTWSFPICPQHLANQGDVGEIFLNV